MKTKEYWIDKLELQAHPEGGFFKETYRSSESISEKDLPERFDADRNFSTSIYFLLAENNISAFHRIKQDELWHFHYGSSLTIHMISPSGDYTTQKLGLDIDHAESPQVIVPAEYYFAAEVNDKSTYVLSGCTVAPGFDFADFEMPDYQELIINFPEHESIISKLTNQ
jgi:predicted cupin superfamily sugar epimerase